MENNTDQKPTDESLKPAEVEGVEVAQAPAAEEEANSQDSGAETQTPEAQAAGSDADADKKDDAPASAAETPAPIQPVIHKSGAPILAIVTAVLVSIGLAGITVYAYMQAQKDNKPAASQTTTEDNSAAESSQEIEDTSKEIDKALEASEETDFPEDELSDQSLDL